MPRIDQMHTKHVSIEVTSANVTANTSFYRPFNIHLGAEQIIAIHAILVQMLPSFAPDNAEYQSWALLQKRLVRGDDVEALRPIRGFIGDEDNDLLVRGVFSFATLATAVDQQNPDPQYIKFPEPIWVPRSPTFEVQGQTGNLNIFMYATLFYRKHKVSKDQLIGLMKQFVGRKQNVVSTIPRVIDE